MKWGSSGSCRVSDGLARNDCVDFGFRPGTYEYCVMNQSNNRREMQASQNLMMTYLTALRLCAVRKIGD